MNFITLPRLAAVAGALALAGGAQAASIISATATFAPITELITFDGYDGLIYGPPESGGPNLYLDSDGDVLLTSTVGAVTVGANALDLEGNGLWGARFGLTPTGEGNFLSATAPINFNFGADGPQAQVGAFFNHSQQSGPTTLTLTAYDDNMVQLESFSYTVTTPSTSYNEGMFLGFARTQADISNFGISITSGQSLVMDNLGLTIAPIPEPETYAMLFVGLGALGFAARRHSAKS